VVTTSGSFRYGPRDLPKAFTNINGMNSFPVHVCVYKNLYTLHTSQCHIPEYAPGN